MSVQSIHQFAEKVALISDAASPVGRSVAMQLALNGSYVIGLFEHDAGSVEELVELGTLAHGVKADPSTFAGASEAATEVEKIFGRLDLLVNCLKSRPESSFEHVTESVFTDMVNKDLGSVYFLTNAVLGLMKQRPKPKIVNLASTKVDDNDPLSAACQAGIIGMTHAMAKTLPQNFRVNCIEVKDDKAARRYEEGLMLRSDGSVAPDDVARAVLFLLSSESTGINGEVIRLG
jgi:NAD(P)-dependent dehydrogenase (short-subunit alcohol dehydrogenase family)